MRIAALDIGGTSIKSGIWDGREISRFKETDTNAKEGGLRLMDRALEILKGYGEFDGIGISTAGQVDTEKGTIYYANDNIPGYTGMEVRRMVEEAFQKPAAVENDVNAAAFGEGGAGAARGEKDFLCLTYGTGVGGAIVIDGKLYRGSSWSGGSFGGIVVHPERLKAGEEFSGCYEKYASVTALVERAKREDESLVSGRKIFAEIQRPQVRRMVDQWIDEVVFGLVTLVHVFNPPCIVLGGGIMEQPYVLGQVREKLPPLVSPGFRGVKLLRAGLGNRAGLTGAALLAERRMKGLD